MYLRRTICGLFLTAALLLPAPLVRADNHDNPRIATVNTAKIFGEMQETKDLRQKMDADGKAIEAEREKRKTELQELQKKRELFSEGSADFEKINKDLIQKAVEMQAWQELTKAELNRQQKTQMRNLFNKIEDAVKTVAQQKNLDLVFVDQKMELPTDSKTMEQITIDQLRGLINQRNIVYNNNRLDITNDVLALVDANYKAKK